MDVSRIGMFSQTADGDLDYAGDWQLACHVPSHVAVTDTELASHADLRLSHPIQQSLQLIGCHVHLRQSSSPPFALWRLAISRKSGCRASLASCHSVEEGGFRS
jgi:hypothetical protein